MEAHVNEKLRGRWSCLADGWRHRSQSQSLEFNRATVCLYFSAIIRGFCLFCLFSVFARWHVPQSVSLYFLMYLLLQAKSRYLICKGPVISSVSQNYAVKMFYMDETHGASQTIFGLTWLTKRCRLLPVSAFPAFSLFLYLLRSTCVFLYEPWKMLF